jgi:hypothetical protein
VDGGTEGYDGRVYDFLLNLPTMHDCNCLAILHRQPAADGFCPALFNGRLVTVHNGPGGVAWHNGEGFQPSTSVRWLRSLIWGAGGEDDDALTRRQGQ